MYSFYLVYYFNIRPICKLYSIFNYNKLIFLIQTLILRDGDFFVIEIPQVAINLEFFCFRAEEVQGLGTEQ